MFGKFLRDAQENGTSLIKLEEEIPFRKNETGIVTKKGKPIKTVYVYSEIPDWNHA